MPFTYTTAHIIIPNYIIKKKKFYDIKKYIVIYNFKGSHKPTIENTENFKHETSEYFTQLK